MNEVAYGVRPYFFHWRLASLDLPPSSVQKHIKDMSSVLTGGTCKTTVEARQQLPAISACDWPGSEELNVSQMLWLYRAAGQLDLEWRDVPGCGHARLFGLAECEHSEKIRTEIGCGRYWSVAITEPDGGSDPLSMKTVALFDGQHFRINGEKMFVGRILEADGVIVFTRNERSPGLSAFALHRQQAGISSSILSSSGLTGTSWSQVLFQDVSVDLSWRIGAEGQGMSLLHRQFAYWRLMMTAAVIGAAESLLVELATFARQRNIASGSLHQAPHFQIEFARVIGRMRGAWALVVQTAEQIIIRSAESEVACLAKAEGVSAALECVEIWRRFMGARAFLSDTSGARQARAIEAFRSADGATDALYVAVAKRLLETQ